MLCELSIKNFAIIDDLNISFSGGLTVLTGETGAGKSIIINAVNLLLGSRASSKLIRTGEKTAELEAFFRLPEDGKSLQILEAQGLSDGDQLIVRRVITHTDRHKIYINGRISTIGILTALTENLASISGQHAHQGLLKEDVHLQLLDQFGGLLPLRNKVHKKFHEILPLAARLKRLERERLDLDKNLDLMRFQQREISDAEILTAEDKTLEAQIKTLKNAEALYKTVFASIEELYTGDGSISENMNTINKNLEKAVIMDPALSSEHEGLVDLRFKLEDIAERMQGYLHGLDRDGQALETAQSRLDILQKLKRKYGDSLENVTEHLKNIEAELSGAMDKTDEIEKCTQNLKTLHDSMSQLAERLSLERKKISKRFSKRVEKELSSLGMPTTRFSIEFGDTPVDAKTDTHLNINGRIAGETGLDSAVFMIAPNPGEALKPLSKTASGGELSRVVLALKAMLAKIDAVGTIVFDEVDAGIGGGIAEVVGKKLVELSKYHQVICITHLAQIAKFGTSHFKIAKHVKNGRTSTRILSMNQHQRVEEVARMLGGVAITPKTLEHARELLDDTYSLPLIS